MKKRLHAFNFIVIPVLLSLISVPNFAQTLEWQLVSPTYSSVDPDAGGPAVGSATFKLQIHTTSGTASGINVLATGWSFQSAKAMIPTTPGCAIVNSPANVTVSAAFVAGGFSYSTVNQCGTFSQTTGGETYDKRAVGTLEGASIDITTTWVDVFSVTLWSLSNSSPEAGTVVINSGSGGAPGQFTTYSVSDAGANEYPVSSLTYATPLSLNSTVLPITLTKFDVDCNTKGVKLIWQTLTEQNTGRFEIEKSSNGATGWTTIGTSVAAGNSNAAKNYEFIDLRGGFAFYRLKQIDKDGKYTYTGIRKINCTSKQANIFVYPVPAKNILNVVVATEKNSKATILLVDVAGKVVRQMQTQMQAGSNNFKFDVSGLARGEYFLKVIGSDNLPTQKVSIVN